MSVNFVDGEGDRGIHDMSSIGEGMSKEKKKNLQPGESLSTSKRRGEARFVDEMRGEIGSASREFKWTRL